MKPSKFISHYERVLGRPLSVEELRCISGARSGALGKRDAVKAMRSALLVLTPEARPGYHGVIAASVASRVQP